MAATSRLCTAGLHSTLFSGAYEKMQGSQQPREMYCSWTQQQRQGVQVKSIPSCSYVAGTSSQSRGVRSAAVVADSSPVSRNDDGDARVAGKVRSSLLSLDTNSDELLSDEERQHQRRKEVSKRIQQLGKNGQASAAVQMMVAMMEEGIMPDKVAATALVQACIQAGDTKRAESIFSRFFGKDGALIADTKAFATLLRSYASNKPPRWPKIMALIASMEPEYNVKPTAGVYNVLLGVCAITNETERAVDLMQKMESEDIGPDMLTYEAIRRRRVLRNQYRTIFARFLDGDEAF